MKKHSLRNKIGILIVLIAVGVCIFLAGYSSGQRGVNLGFGIGNIINTEQGKPSSVDFSIFWEAWEKLQNKSVQGVDTAKMIEGAISGMAASLDDPYTVFLSRENNQRFREDIEGEFGGVGMEMVLKNGVPTVVAPISGTPAEKAGIKAGDIILEVDGQKSADLGFDKTINKIRGPENTKVKLKIFHEGAEEPVDIELTREIILIKSVEWELKKHSGKKIFYIKMRQFGDDTDALFAEAAKQAVESNPDAIMLDLRNNPGGYLETAVNVSSYFIDSGVIVSEKGKNNNNKDYMAEGKAKLKNYDVVILANEGSASASEIVAGALQDRKGSKIVGEKTFGKGSVQELVDLSDGSAMKVTVAKWFTPSGRQINGEGISPDIEVKKDEQSQEDNQLVRALEFAATKK